LLSTIFLRKNEGRLVLENKILRKIWRYKNCVKHAEIVNKASAAKASSSSSLIRLFVIHCATLLPRLLETEQDANDIFYKISTCVLYLQEQQPETVYGNKIKVRHFVSSGTRVASLFLLRYDTVTKTSCQ
jgi:hypothetical protein